MAGCREERGSVSVLAAGILVLAGLLSLAAVDLLRVLAAISAAQAAADAGALAAAQEIAVPTGQWSPAEAARHYARRNGAMALACDCDPWTSEAVVEVEVSVDLLLVGPDRSLRRRARAVVEGASPPGRPATQG